MRTARPPGEVADVKLRRFHSTAASRWDRCDRSLSDVCTGEDRLEGEFTLSSFETCSIRLSFSVSLIIYFPRQSPGSDRAAPRVPLLKEPAINNEQRGQGWLGFSKTATGSSLEAFTG